jgi:hypothetical protein
MCSRKRPFTADPTLEALEATDAEARRLASELMPEWTS